MPALNPNNEILQAAEDQWHKIVFIMLRKFGVDHVDITMDDVRQALAESDKFAVCLDCRSHGKPEPTMSVRIVPMAEAIKLASEAGGRPM